MVNPKDTENFYMQKAGAEFDYNSISRPYDELDGISALVEMAKQGKIDPWNIDIADIADKYMLHLAEKKADNLRLSSRAWLFLAILLKLKSNVLAGIDIVQFEEPLQTDDGLDTGADLFEPEETPDYYGNKVIPIEDIIQRRTSVKLNRRRTVTLKDLIRQLEFYEQIDKKQSVQNALDRAKRKVTAFKNLSSSDIINLAQEDYIEPGVRVLEENLINMFEKEDKIELNALAKLGLDRTTAYMSLLFLSAKSSYTLVQEEFYSKLYVTKNEQIYAEAAKEEQHGLEIKD